MDQIQPYLDYFAAHPAWALAVIFLIAFGEALLVIGLFVPSTAVLVGAGALVGTGKLDFWPVMIATTIGCILGDQVSYWAGRVFGDRLKTFWPLSAYPALVAKGEEFMKVHGGKSIALGRFVPGIKSVVPGIAGMFGMGQVFFLSINVVSGIAWAFVHLFPGILLGQALSLAGELSGRLLFLLLLLLIILAVAGWLIRLIFAGFAPYRKALQARAAAWARAQGSKPMRRFSRAIGPQNPKSVLIFMSLLFSPLLLLFLGDIVSGRVLGQAVGNLDYSIFNIFTETRNAPADELFIRITMLADDFVLFAMTAAACLWLLAQRAWRAALSTALTVLATKLIVSISSAHLGFHLADLLSPDLSENMIDKFSFPSDHTVMAGVVFGIFAVLSSRNMSSWAKALVAATCGIVVIAISFSRIYLGVNWLSDILAGLILAAVIVTFYAALIGTLPARRIKPIGLLLTGLVAFLLATAVHISSSYDKNEDLYLAANKTVTYSLSDWLDTGWKKTRMRRVDLAGKPEEVFAVQWIGPLPALEALLQKAGFVSKPKWTWRDSFPYLDPHAPLAHLAPRPSLHEGLKAKLTAISVNPAQPDSRTAIRVYASNDQINDAPPTPIYLVSLTKEILKPRFNLLSVPSDEPSSSAEEDDLLAAFIAQPNVEKLQEETVDGRKLLILRPK
jgi:membrane protein DedA with SNARE-associated domain/membrane-associated phospholipid phosphatase